MKGGFRVFRVIGIDISVDYSWFVIFGLVTWSLGAGYFPAFYPALPAVSHWVMGVVSSLLLFGSVLLHELSHSYVANRFGQNIRRIRLFIFGGVAELSREPDDPGKEFYIAVAGPVCSLTLHVVFGLMASLFGTSSVETVCRGIFSFLSYVNGALALFNMIPGFPLDGGRILRSILWKRWGNIARATKVASSIGKYFAVFLIVAGFATVLRGDLVGGLWYVFIGMFLQNAAASSYEGVVVKTVLDRIRVSDVMVRGPVAVPGDMPVDRVVEDYFFRYRFDSFPVEAPGSVSRVITLDAIKRVPREQRHAMTAAACSHPVPRDLTLRADDMILSALSRMADRDHTHFFVTDGERIVGVLTRHDVAKLLKFKLDLG